MLSGTGAWASRGYIIGDQMATSFIISRRHLIDTSLDGIYDDNDDKMDKR